jgi:uncharacterized membrane protein
MKRALFKTKTAALAAVQGMIGALALADEAVPTWVGVTMLLLCAGQLVIRRLTHGRVVLWND